MSIKEQVRILTLAKEALVRGNDELARDLISQALSSSEGIQKVLKARKPRGKDKTTNDARRAAQKANQARPEVQAAKSAGLKASYDRKRLAKKQSLTTQIVSAPWIKKDTSND